MAYRYIWTMELTDPDRRSEFIEHWQRVSSILQSFPGALGSHLHELEGEAGTLLMIGEWTDAAARARASAGIRDGVSEQSRLFQELPPDESFGKKIVWLATEIEAVAPAAP
jgi:quinol monooxygenase YgiN